MKPTITLLPTHRKYQKSLKGLLGLSFFLCLPFLGSAQQQGWQWGIRGGSVTTNGNNVPITETVDDMAVDEQGNTYIVSTMGGGIGRQGGTLSGMGGNLPFYGETDNSKAIVLVSYDCNGDYRWSKTVSGYGSSGGPNVGVDTLGHVYMTGDLSRSYKNFFTGEEFLTHFGTDSLIPYSDKENEYKKTMFLARYDTSGNFEELIMPQSDSVNIFVGSSIAQETLDLMVDPDGTQHWLMNLKETSYPPTGEDLIPVIEGDTLADGYHVVKYDKDGNHLGTTAFEIQEVGVVDSFKFRMNHDPVRDVYYFAGQNYSYNFPDSDLEIGGQVVESEMFVAKFNAQGQAQWLREGSPDLSRGYFFPVRPQLDLQGNIYLAAYMDGDYQNGQQAPVSFLSFTAQNTHGPASFPALIKMSPDGNVIWGIYGETDNNALNSVTAINGQEIAFAGPHVGIQWGSETFPPVYNSGYDIFMARFDKEDGSFIAMDSLDSSYGADEKPTALVADKRGNVYVGGDFESRLYINGDTLNKNGSQTDFFVAKFGQGNCNCTLPEARFSYSVSTPGEVTYSFTGSGYDELEWSYGNGQTEVLNTNTASHTYTGQGEYWACVTVYNSCGYDTWCTLVDPFALGTPGVLANSTLTHYPNPVREELTVESREALGYRLYGLSGKQVRSGRFKSGNNHLDVADLPQGLYMLRVEDSGGKTLTLKVVKE